MCRSDFELIANIFYDPVCCFVFFFAVVTEAISFLLITLQFSEFHIARDSKRKMECVAAYSSLYPLMIYYLNRLNDWGLYFRKCKICGKVFLAKSQRYELCSDKCRKKQSLQNKREFDERARENNYDLLYKMSARTGETKSIRQRKLLVFLLSVWKKCWLLLNPSKRSFATETGCEKENSQPKGIFRLASPAE